MSNITMDDEVFILCRVRSSSGRNEGDLYTKFAKMDKN
jgi:hypothetical protein